MDLQQIRNKITENKYELRSQFMSDLALILNNSKKYNGVFNPITEAAKLVSWRDARLNYALLLMFRSSRRR